MPLHEIKRYRLECDFCTAHHEFRLAADKRVADHLPNGWVRETPLLGVWWFVCPECRASPDIEERKRQLAEERRLPSAHTAPTWGVDWARDVGFRRYYQNL